MKITKKNPSLGIDSLRGERKYLYKQDRNKWQLPEKWQNAKRSSSGKNLLFFKNHTCMSRFLENNFMKRGIWVGFREMAWFLQIEDDLMD